MSRRSLVAPAVVVTLGAVFMASGVRSASYREPAQSSVPAAGGRLVGRAVTADDQSPVSRARVSVVASGKVSDPVFTDSEGGFEIAVPESGDYRVVVTKAGYLQAAMSQRAAARKGPGTLVVPLVRAAVVAGRVVDSAGRAVVSIRVRLRPIDGGVVTDAETDTDDRGEYRFGGLSAGRYRVQAFGRPEASLSSIPTATLPAQVADTRRPLPNAEPTSDAVAVDVRPGMLTPATLVYYEGTVILPYALVGGMVSGHLVDELGEPAEGVSVQLWRTRFVGGRRVLEAFGAARRSDDRGEYRLFHIPPGPYVVVASDHSWRGYGVPSSPWLPVFYPGTTSPAEAAPLQIGRSQELAGTNVLFVRSRGSRVFGAAIDSDGQPLQTQVSLRPSSRQRGFVLPGWTATTNADGTFEFDGVPPGDHVIQVAPNVGIQVVPAAGQAGERVVLLNAPARSRELALDRVSVSSGDLGPLLVATVPTATISGTAVFEGVRPAGELFAVAAIAADPDFTPSTTLVATAGIDPTSAKFEMRGLGTPVRLVLSSAPRGWWLKAAEVGPFNAALEPAAFKTARDSRDDVTLVLADTAAAISGVVDGQGSSVEGCWIVAFATDPERWFVGSPYVRAVTADQKGRFAVPSLPPGDYWIAAVFSVGGDADSGEWQHADFLEALALTARRINLGAKQQLTLAQRLVPTDK